MTELESALDGARNTLLAAPSMSGDETGVCNTLLLPEDPGEASVLWVAFRRDAQVCVDQWLEQTDDRPRNAAVIIVGDSPGSVSESSFEVDSISNPSDLTGLGIRIGKYLSRWEEEPVVCVDSLTAMLQYVDVQTAYEFLHAITGQLYAADARAHFHIDPNAHDTETVAAITTLFDAVVELAGEEPEIRTRQLLG